MAKNYEHYWSLTEIKVLQNYAIQVIHKYIPNTYFNNDIK